MAAIIELKYFNAFALKKIKNIVGVTPGMTGVVVSGSAGTFTLNSIKPVANEIWQGDGTLTIFQIISIPIEQLGAAYTLQVFLDTVEMPEVDPTTGVTNWIISTGNLEFLNAAPASGVTIKLTSTPPLTFTVTEMNVGQEISFSYMDVIDPSIIRNYKGNITERISDQQIRVSPVAINYSGVAVSPATEVIATLGKITDFQFIPGAYREDGEENREESWLLEESRIRGGYNNSTVDFGVRAYLAEDEPRQSHKFSGLIHSGAFNSRTGFNATNQFSVGEDITRTIDPANGSIQKLYAEDTNLIIFQENKVSKSLIDKDAIYTAEGNPQLTATNKVIGQNVSYGGEFGISKDPESFAVNGYRKYFTDRDQNIVCRLSRDGITPISSVGMTDYFRDILPGATSIRGGWDAHNKQYILSIGQGEDYDTLAYDESSKGWVSKYSYRPDTIFSVNNNYYTTYEGMIWQHHSLTPGSSDRGLFYGVQYNSSISFVFNGAPSAVKNMQTINYEGDSGWAMASFETNTDIASTLAPASFAISLEQMENQMFVNSFKAKEDKYYGTLINITPISNGEVVFGSASSGVKGFYGAITMELSNAGSGPKELFAVSTTFVPSS
jgi:hypothetical protein